MGNVGEGTDFLQLDPFLCLYLDFQLFWAIVFRVREEQGQDLECRNVHKNMLKLRWLIELLHWLELKILLYSDEHNVVTF